MRTNEKSIVVFVSFGGDGREAGGRRTARPPSHSLRRETADVFPTITMKEGDEAQVCCDGEDEERRMMFVTRFESHHPYLAAVDAVPRARPPPASSHCATRMRRTRRPGSSAPKSFS